MGRLIDANAFEVISLKGKSEEFAEGVQWLAEQIDNAPTVEAIPKDQHEARLKADMVAMLTDLQLEIEEHKMTSGVTNQGTWNECIACCSKVIQQKINALKGDSDGA